MTTNPFQGLSPTVRARRERIAALSARALPVVLGVLFLMTAFAKVIASIAHSVAIILFLLHWYLTREPIRSGRVRTYYVLLAAYSAVMLVSLVNTAELQHGIRLFRTILWKLMIAVVLAETVRSMEDVRRYLRLYAAGTAILAVIAVYQGVVQQVYRPPSMWIAVHGGNLLMFGLIVMIALAVHAVNNRERMLLLGMMALSGYALYLNGTRGVWVAMACVVAIVPLLLPRRSWKGTAISYALLLVAALLVAQAPFVREKFREARDNLVQYEQDQHRTSVGYRIDMWKASLALFRERPLLGVGLGDWQHEVGRLIDAGSASPTIRQYGQTHNVFLDAASTQGVAGLAALLAILFYPARITGKGSGAGRELGRTLFWCATVACFVSGMTDTLVHIRGVFLSYLMLVGLSLAVGRGLMETQEKAERIRKGS